MKLKHVETKKARIEIIPMIDAIFFLLVFFMFSSLSMIRMAGSSVALPTKATGPTGKTQQDNKTVVTVNADGRLFIGKSQVRNEELRDSLRKRLSGIPDPVVIINLDKRQKAQRMIDIIDMVNGVKLPSGQTPAIMIATEPVQAGGG